MWNYEIYIYIVIAEILKQCIYEASMKQHLKDTISKIEVLFSYEFDEEQEFPKAVFHDSDCIRSSNKKCHVSE